MCRPTRYQPVKLTDQYTLDHTMQLLRQHLQLYAHGYTCQTTDLWRIVLAAAARHTTIEAVCADLTDAPAANTVRDYLTAQLSPDDVRNLERCCNAALAAVIPPGLRARPQEIALDEQDEPYYGRCDPDEKQNWVCRGEARAGTTYFYRCATAYVMLHDRRLTLAVVFVKPGDAPLTIVERLITQVAATGVPIRRLYADKGFCSIAVLTWLAAHHLPAILAVPIRGKQGGTRALCRGRRSYRTTHTFQSAEHGRLRVDVAVARTYARRRSGKRTATWCLYACPAERATPQRIRKRYRRRFGIESSYRQMEQVRARTTSPKPALRFLLMGVALLILNVWIDLHWLFLRVPGRGRARVARAAFRLDRMTRFLTRAIERYYGVVTTIDGFT
jgi:putative transposase